MPYADLNNVRIYYETDGQGPPVVLLTGFVGDVRFWDRATELLSPEFTVIRLDNRGSGSTEYEGQFTMDDLADDVTHLMDHLGIRRANIVGWSLGSNVALDFAVRYPERVETLTVIASYSFRPARSKCILQAMVDAVSDGMSPEHFGKMLNALCFTEELFKKKETEGSAIGLPILEDVFGLRTQLDAVEGFDVRETAKGITAPTLIVHGTADIMVDIRFGDALNRLIPNSGIFKVEGQTHIIPPKLYIPAVIEHIKLHSGRA
ncbi:MAG: alpha/beta hydrolase [Candidatus Methanoplasma sp.]|jgi:pimeloyl-ACP methyl ester carboxylesterase|nr:alpha/beta hydrolase [Candidatus Methanoplasma sp.]